MLLLGLLTALAGPFDAVDALPDAKARVEALLPLTKGTDGAEAWSRLGHVLVAEGRVGAASLAFARAIQASPERATTDGALALGLAEQTGDLGPITAALGDSPPAPPPGDDGARAAYLVARELLRAERLSDSRAWIDAVDTDAPAYADAQSLLGVLLAAQGKHTDALAPLQTARALGQAQGRDRRFDDKLLLNLARIYYASRNDGQAIFHYALVPRDSDFWPEARFEKAWSHFRAGDPATAIGELQAHQSPFFDHLWFPEGWMLRAQSLFVMCRYGDAIEAIDATEAHYRPVLDQLDAALEGLNPARTFDLTSAYLDGQAIPLPKTVMRAYRYEDRIAEAREAVRRYRAEAEALTALSPDVAKLVQERADALVQSEGQRILSRLRRQRDELANLLRDVELARIDILDMESRLYQQAAATGQLEQLTVHDRLKTIQRERRGYRVWPFQGEYWIDELGWFQVTAGSACPPEKTAR